MFGLDIQILNAVVSIVAAGVEAFSKVGIMGMGFAPVIGLFVVKAAGDFADIKIQKHVKAKQKKIEEEIKTISIPLNFSIPLQKNSKEE